MRTMQSAFGVRGPGMRMGRDLTAELLRSTGFQDPVLVRPTASVADTRKVRGVQPGDSAHVPACCYDM